MKSLTAILLFSLASAAYASMPVVMATGQGQSYETEQQAVKQALIDASVHYTSEYGGVVYELNGKYFYTTPATVEEASQVRFEIRMLRSARLVALYHTHTPGAQSDLFSQCDIQVATQLRVPSYILVLDKGEIESYTPGTDKVYHIDSNDLDGGLIDVSRGTLIEKISAKVGATL